MTAGECCRGEQLFSPRFTLILRLIVVAIIALVTLAIITYRINARFDAPASAPVDQIVPFSHKHHVSDDGIDCRYCHGRNLALGNLLHPLAESNLADHR